MTFRVVIPARYASSRLPGKPLADIAGRPMVVHVAERAAASGAAEVIVATDHTDILSAVARHGYTAVMTRADHPSGTDRIAEVAMGRGWGEDEIVVNVQGDEPCIEARLIARIAAALAADGEAAMATACHPLTSVAEFLDPNVVKVICDARGHALYFSRAPIPWPRDAFAARRDRLPEGHLARRHIGLYAYRVAFLRRFGALGIAPPERLEALEQLRALWHGYRIRVCEIAEMPEAGVDTAEDLERVRRRFDAGRN